MKRISKNKLYLRQKQAPDLSVGQLRQALDGLPDTPTGLRKLAILMLSFTGAFRRSEFGHLDLNHTLTDGAVIGIGLDRSKSNQFGEIEEKLRL